MKTVQLVIDCNSKWMGVNKGEKRYTTFWGGWNLYYRGKRKSWSTQENKTEKYGNEQDLIWAMIELGVKSLKEPCNIEIYTGNNWINDVIKRWSKNGIDYFGGGPSGVTDALKNGKHHIHYLSNASKGYCTLIDREMVYVDKPDEP